MSTVSAYILWAWLESCKLLKNKVDNNMSLPAVAQSVWICITLAYLHLTCVKLKPTCFIPAFFIAGGQHACVCTSVEMVVIMDTPCNLCTCTWKYSCRWDKVRGCSYLQLRLITWSFSVIALYMHRLAVLLCYWPVWLLHFEQCIAHILTCTQRNRHILQLYVVVMVLCGGGCMWCMGYNH